jgi:hypothetical protein
VRHLAHEPQKIEQGMLNVEGPCREMAARSRENGRKKAKPDVGQGALSYEMQAVASRGRQCFLATLGGNRSPITL